MDAKSRDRLVRDITDEILRKIQPGSGHDDGGPCECRPAGGTTTAANVCKGGNCRTDEDCGAGGYCSPSFGSCGRYLGVVAYYCHTPKDKCVDDADCAGTAGADCRYNQVMGAWMCETTQCAG